jgi:hypothetical protein
MGASFTHARWVMGMAILEEVVRDLVGELAAREET